MQYMIQFSDAAEMQGALDLLSGKAQSEAPVSVAVTNATGQSIKLVGKPNDDGTGIEVTIAPRTEATGTMLAHGERVEIL